jgi:ureidoacrylate peracid hydrolase
MSSTMQGPQFAASALLVVDMQNDFLHPEGYSFKTMRSPEAQSNRSFLAGTIPQVKRLVDAFRNRGRPVVYLAHMLRGDYSDAQFPYWRLGLPPASGRTFIVEGTWGAQIVDELKPQDGDQVIIKKGFGGFSNTPLDTVLRNMGVTTCVVSGVMTSVCVSTTVRGGVEYNYRMVVASDAVADINRENHYAELKILARAFADTLTVDEVNGALQATEFAT